MKVAGDAAGGVYLVLVTGPDAGTLEALGREAVERRLAACVSVLPRLSSVYRWRGEVEEAAEALALVKTTGGRLEALEAWVREEHPYDEPEFLAFAVDAGSPSYLDWVAASVEEG